MSSWADIAAQGGNNKPDTQPRPAPPAEASKPNETDIGDCEFSPSDDIFRAIHKLWDLDENRLEPHQDYELDIQGYTSYHGNKDYARHPLFKFVNHDALHKPTYWAFYNLLDNYSMEVGVEEKITMEEKHEVKDFINLIYETKVIRYLHKFLAHKGIGTDDPLDMKKILVGLWFRMYNSTKGGPKDSSGFEHVFVGELKQDSVTGMHNWLQLYKMEAKGLLDYKGYVSRDKKKPGSDSQILTLQFTAANEADVEQEGKKNLSTSFIGVSPEFEIAVYTLLACCGEEPCTKEIKGKEVTRFDLQDRGEGIVDINIIKWGRGIDAKIRTAYPVQ